MTEQEALEDLVAWLEGFDASTPDAAKWLSALRALMQRDADVRELDEWAGRPGVSGAWNNTRNEAVSRTSDEFMVELIEDGSDDDTNYHLADSPDAARHAAAEWVRQQTKDQRSST